MAASEPGGSVPSAMFVPTHHASCDALATIVTKNVPGWDEASDLDREGAFRVNLNVGRANLPAVDGDVDHAEEDRVLPHPQYAKQGWVSIVDPGRFTEGDLVRLLDIAHEGAAARRVARHAHERAE